MKKILMMLVGLISVASASAQITIALGSSYEVVAGTKVNIPVTVTGLDANNGGSPITSAEIHILYQITNLTYDTTINITSITNATDWIYNATETDYGTTWQDPGFNAYSFPDGTVLFEVVFDYKGGVTILDLDSVRCVLSDVDYNILPVDHFIDGIITPADGSDLSKWNGTGDWNTSGNWSNGVPGINTIATIESGLAEIISNANCKSLTINSLCSVRVLPEYTLTVSEGITNNGTFTIESDETGTGSVIANGAIEGTGDYTTELFVDFTVTSSHLASSPLTSTEGSIFTGLAPMKYNESVSDWQVLDPGETLQQGKGVKITSETDNTLVFQGPFNSADVTITDLLYTSGNNNEFKGLNLLGNPFPSAINADLPNWNKSGVGNGVYLWNGYNYLCWNGFTGSLTDGIIPGMQGFFIRSNEAVSSLTIPAISRLHSTLPFYKETRELENTLVFRFSKETDPEHYDETFISLRSNASSAYEPVNDVVKLSGDPSFPQIYTLSSDDNKLAINTQSEFSGIPVIFNARGTAAYRITVSGISSFANDTPLFLEDKLVPDNTINLRSTQSFLFTFEDGTTPDNRYILHFSTIGINELSSDYFKAWISAGYLHIESEQLQKIEQLQLVSLTGSILYSNENLTTPSVIRLEKWSGGIAILKIRTAEGFFTKKVLLTN